VWRIRVKKSNKTRKSKKSKLRKWETTRRRSIYKGHWREVGIMHVIRVFTRAVCECGRAYVRARALAYASQISRAIYALINNDHGLACTYASLPTVIMVPRASKISVAAFSNGPERPSFSAKTIGRRTDGNSIRHAYFTTRRRYSVSVRRIDCQ